MIGDFALNLQPKYKSKFRQQTIFNLLVHQTGSLIADK